MQKLSRPETTAFSRRDQILSRVDLPVVQRLFIRLAKLENGEGKGVMEPKRLVRAKKSRPAEGLAGGQEDDAGPQNSHVRAEKEKTKKRSGNQNPNLAIERTTVLE